MATRDGTSIRDFPGLVTNATDRALPPGAASVLVNLSPRAMGSVRTRKGLKPLSFQVTTTVSLASLVTN